MEEKKEFFHPERPVLPGTKVVGKIDLEPKKKKEKEPVELSPEELQMRAKVGYQFDKIWKEKFKSRLEMQKWAIKLLGLKLPPEDFSINKLTVDQVQLLGLKLKFEFNLKK